MLNDVPLLSDVISWSQRKSEDHKRAESLRGSEIVKERQREQRT